MKVTSADTLRSPHAWVTASMVAVTSAAPAPEDSKTSPTRRARSSDS